MLINLGSAVFLPFTYELLQTNFEDYKKEYKEAEAQYDALLLESLNSLLLSQETNPLAYEQYNNYLNLLDLAAKDLSSGRINRNLLRSMKRGYYSTIQPIKKAEEKVAAANKLKLDLFAQGKDLEYKNPKYTIDDALAGVEFDSTAMDLNKVKEQGENLAINLAGIYKPGMEFVGGIGNYNNKGNLNLLYIEHTGYTKELFDKASELFENVVLGDGNVYNLAAQAEDANSNMALLMAKSMLESFDSINTELVENEYSLASKRNVVNKFLNAMNKGLDNPKEIMSANGEYKTAHQRTSEALSWANINFQKEQANKYYKSTDDKGVTHYYHGTLEVPKSSVPNNVSVEELTWSEWNLINLNQGKAPGKPSASKEKEVVFKMEDDFWAGFSMKKSSITHLDGWEANAETKEKVVNYIRDKYPEIPADNIKDVFVDDNGNVSIKYNEGSIGTITSSEQVKSGSGGGLPSDTTTNRTAISIVDAKGHKK